MCYSDRVFFNMRQYNCVAAATRIFKLMMATLALSSLVNYALAATCDVKPSAPPIIQHNLTTSQAFRISYCELCGYGHVTIVITNPYVGADMIDMAVVENPGLSGRTVWVNE